MITQGMLHYDKRVLIQKPPQAYHLVESALGTMVSLSLFLSAQDTLTGASFFNRCDLNQIIYSGQILTNSESNTHALTD